MAAMQLWATLRCLVGVLALLLVDATSAQAQRQIELSGRIVAAHAGSPVPGATVEVPGIGRVLTRDDGSFHFPGLPPAWLSIRITALGYVTEELDLLLHRDTSILIHLQLQPIRLDTVTVRAAFHTLRGRVVARGTGQRLVDAQVFTGSAAAVRTGLGGRFAVGGIPSGQDVLFQVEALGFEPLSGRLTIDNDTTVVFELEPDPLGQELIAAQARRLLARTQASGYSVEHIGADEIMRRGHLTALDVVQTRLGTRAGRVQCVLIDDRVRQLDELRAYPTEIVHRIEILDRSRMVRLYTTSFLQQMVEGRVTLRPIQLLPRAGGVSCM
ncbi:MAG TPA: carboxypeptidase regulatory-like domain-containing protein [Longimicrobiales bacterium]|nr:carboxypeptidase regulatory-like domain-containing protein [Longimicrobiales bacterium]